MSKIYVFCIGGTGSRVLRSLAMMMASGVSIGVDEIVPIVIDPDASNGDLSRTNALLNKYSAIRDNLTFADNVSTKFFRKAITQIIPNYILNINNTNDQTFRQFVDLASMSRSNQALMSILFSEKNLNSSMDDGFKGNPNIGSVVLNQIVGSPDFNSFATNFSQGDKIFIISSIFGGTGASGFPLLLNTLRTGNSFPNFALINAAEIGAITILPYFNLQKNSNSEIDSSTFISKTKSALAYYENNIVKNGLINSIYYLADTITNTYANNQGGATQANDAHIIEFLAATAIIDFCENQQIGTVNKEFGLQGESKTISFNSFYKGTRDKLFFPLTQFMMMANCLKYKFDFYSSDSFNANKENFKDLYRSTYMSDLQEFLDEFINWISELKRNNRSLDLFNVENGAKRPFEIVTGVKPKRIISIKSDYDLVTSRLNAAVRKCNSKSVYDKFLEMFYIGTEKLVSEKF